MAYSPLLQQLIEALCCLPGVGPKSAQRMAFHLLERDRNGAHQLADKLKHAMNNIGHCKRCRSFSETDLCVICSNPARDKSKICIVESPADVAVLEQASVYKGLYFVLMGHLSPLDGIGPKELCLDQLMLRLRDEECPIQELILATNATVEGEATAHYILDMIDQPDIRVSRIAHGVPVGGELEYVDGGTLLHAFTERRSVLKLTR